MAIFVYLEVLIFAVIIFLYLRRHRHPTAAPTNFPVIGMLPGLLQNSHRVHDFVTDVLREFNGTFLFKGPWFCNMDMVITSDPANIHHVFSKKFSNYPKGKEFKEIFEILGDGIFNADFELWELHRKTTLSFLTSNGFSNSLEKTVWGKVETGLFPVLNRFVEKRSVFDLQDIFQRFTFDSISTLVLDFDPKSLSLGLPEIPSEKAFNDVIEALLYRHILPEKIWKLMKILGIGKERRLAAAWKAFDDFICPAIGDGENGQQLLRSFTAAYEEKGAEGRLKEFLRDTSLNLLFAGRDTTSTCLTWLFWLIGKNPAAESKILQELEKVLQLKPGEKWRFFTAEESRRLVYLHGALSESLRLFPPVALEHKSPLNPDTLPTGIHVNKNTKLIFSFYSAGRMEWIWGKDWADFKPERWISSSGSFNHEPSYKFPAFNVGPRTCLGKDMAYIQMKMVAAAIIFDFNVELVDNGAVAPRDSIILQAKNGLKVKLSKRIV